MSCPTSAKGTHGGAIRAKQDKGGPFTHSRDDVLRACRLGWTILVVKGTGGFADELLNEKERREAEALHLLDREEELDEEERTKHQREQHAQCDVVIDEILENGEVRAIDLNQDVDTMTELLQRVSGHFEVCV